MDIKKRCKIIVKVLWSFLLGVVLLTAILAYIPTLAQLSPYNSQGLKATTLEEVLALPDEEIDLATAILILSKKWDASLDITISLEEIEKMALELEGRISPEDTPEKIVNLINDYLFEKKGYSVLKLYPFGSGLEKWALPWVIENKKGNCLGLSLLYLTLAERLRLPFYGVVAPYHIFVRYDDGKKKINIETTKHGKEYEDIHYEKNFMLPSTSRDYNFYLRNLSKREVIGILLNSLGLAYDRKGIYDEAITEYREAIEIIPDYAETYYNLGNTYYSKGMYDEAIAEYRKAIESNPNFAWAHYNLGNTYHGKGMYDEAIAEYKKAIEINPTFASAHNNLGVAYYKKEMYDEALTEFKKAIEINPYFAEAHINLAEFYYYKEEYSLAIEHYDRAIELGYRGSFELLEALKPYR